MHWRCSGSEVSRQVRTPGWDRITLRHLLSMSSGLKWNENLPWNRSNDEWHLFNDSDPVKYVLQRTVAVPPGSVWNYNGGGYNLARATSEITVADIISAVDEPIDATQCGGKENCNDDRRCVTHDLWSTLNEKMNEYLGSVSLADVVSHQQGKQVQVIKHFHNPGNLVDKAAEKVAA